MKKLTLLFFVISIITLIAPSTFLAKVKFVSKVETIPEAVKQKMKNTTWKLGCPVSLDDLSYLTLSYWDFSMEVKEGHLIVHEGLAYEVVGAFQEIFAAKFPLYSVRPAFEFHGDDHKSMKANNTSAFNCRSVTGNSKQFSKHSYGIAIDLNTIQNPYVKGSQVQPKSGKFYVSRHYLRKGMIQKGTIVYEAFKKRGWAWGGEWKKLKDYQHFEKVSVSLTP